MRSLLMKCGNCGTYTMRQVCSNCGQATTVAHPARFSPDDRYARYRSPLAYKEAPL